MNRLFWSIPVLAVYSYVVTILFDFGYQIYFGVPAYFIQSSVTGNTIFFYILVQSIRQIIINLGWWWLLFLPILGALVFYFQKHIVTLVTVFLIIFAMLAVNFGMSIAQTADTFLMMSDTCPPLGSDPKYILVSIHENEAVFVPIDNENRMVGGFLIKDVTQLSCKLEFKTVGKIIR